jgi:signal transduction histidine kinase
MLSTLRGRMALTLGTLLITVLALAALAVWGSYQADRYLRRSQLADAQLEAYLSLAIGAQRYFRYLAELRTLGPRGAFASDPSLPQQLELQTEHLKTLVRQQVELALDPQDAVSEQTELQQIERLREVLQRIALIFTTLQQIPNHGLAPRRWEILTQTLEQTIDGELQQLVDDALGDERAEAAAAAHRSRELTRRLMLAASLAAAGAVILTGVIGIALFRSIKRPVDALLQGTGQLAAGTLDYRIVVNGPTEFMRLAAGFNHMGVELARQHQALLGAQAELEYKVNERTRELNDANQQLQRLDQARRQFFAEISHELRTPLTVVRGEAEVTLRGADKTAGEYRAALTRISELSVHMGGLVDDLLLLARSDADILQAAGAVETLVLDRLLEETCQHAHALAASQRLTLSLALSDRDLYLRGDRRQLGQLLMSLIDNACRYTPGAGEVMISLERDGTDAVLAVSDTGIGVEADELDQVFERHYRGHRAQLLVPDGNGLGLALARAIAHAHHGTLALASTPGVGTTLTLRLPLTIHAKVDYAAAAG